MPAIDFNFIKSLFDNKEFPLFVETGTYHGQTILAMEPYFEKLFTVEIQKAFYEEVKGRYKGNKINFYLGDSALMFYKICKELDKNTIFFLDGHYSAGDTGKGIKHVPLVEELTFINKYFKHEGIIIVDDFRLFGQGGICDWSDISKEKVLEPIKDRILKVFNMPSDLSKNDRLIIYINSL